MEPRSWTIQYVQENDKNCREYLKSMSYEEFTGIPLLNHIPNNAVPNSSLVRFRGMIQDMLDPEFYLEKYTVASPSGNRIQDGRYMDTIHYHNEAESLLIDAKDNVHGERRSMFVLSVPGINHWVAEVEQEMYSQTPTSCESSRTVKRTVSESMDVDDQLGVSFDPTEPVKRIKVDPTPAETTKPTTVNTNGILSAEYLLNSPIQDRPSKACMVKIYDEEFEKYKLNTLVDVIGFLSMDPSLDGSQDQLSEFDGIDMEEHITSNPPPSLIPRIHAIAIRELKHVNPLLDNESGSSLETDIFKDIHRVLTQCVFGDEVAAYYLFAHLLSSIYARIDVENLGRCSLNLSNLPKDVVNTDYIRSLYEIVELIVPASHYFPLSLENLNTIQFNPKKDFKTNRLTSGLLQLAPHTHLVIDETRLAVGQLQSAGLAALGSMSQLISHQVVKFDFQFYQLDFEMDIPVLVLSEGKSILPSDFHCPIKADPDMVRIIGETLTAAKQFVRTKSAEMRRFLTTAKGLSFTLGDSVKQVLENDLVDLRRDFNMKPDDFHLFLNLSRLIGKSLGKREADAETWELVKKLELERRSRVDALPQKDKQQIES